MKIAVISDIHGNLEALQEVLRDMDLSRPDAVICLGDNIGYGPDPEEVVRVIRKHEIPCVMGNHELGIVRETFLPWFNSLARRSLLLTRQLISEDTVDYIRRMKSSLTYQKALFVHGCPPNSITRYIFDVPDGVLVKIFWQMDREICFVGHTHDLGIISFDGRNVEHTHLAGGLTPLEEHHRYIVNIGSVGQPRDGNNSAKYVIWNIPKGTIEVRYVPYDISKTAAKITQLGFPEVNARRLY